MSDFAKQLQWIDNSHITMCALLEAWAAINSGTFNLKGLALQRQAIKDAFAPLGATMTEQSLAPMDYVNEHGELIKREFAPILIFKKHPAAQKQIILTGHMDTVFGLEHAFQTLNKINSNCWNGPGVTDMKGGLIVMLHALQALESSALAGQLGWTVVINSEEEIGSLGSGDLITSLGRGQDFGLIFEPAMTPEGAIASTRKGSGKFDFIIKGLAAHAGRDFDSGRNAIVAASRLITDIASLNGQRDGVTLNIGRVIGGGALNVVADTCIVRLDVRILQLQDEDWVNTEFANILKHSNALDGISVQQVGGFTRTPKTMTLGLQRLMNNVTDIAKHLDLQLVFKPSGGCCDGNNLAKAGVAVLDSMGVRGANIHRDDEYILLDSLTERAKLAALILLYYADSAFSMEL